MIVNYPSEVSYLPPVPEPEEEPTTVVVISQQQIHKSCFENDHSLHIFADTSIANLIDSVNS